MIKKLIKKYPTLWEIFKFLLVGGLATLVDMLMMAVVMYLVDMKVYDYNFLNVILKSEEYKSLISSYTPVLGTVFGFIFGLIFNYLMSVFFVFENNDFAKTNKGKILFTILAICGLLIHTIGMWLGSDIMMINYWVIKIVLTIVVLVFNYITRKKLIFK